MFEKDVEMKVGTFEGLVKGTRQRFGVWKDQAQLEESKKIMIKWVLSLKKTPGYIVREKCKKTKIRSSKEDHQI